MNESENQGLRENISKCIKSYVKGHKITYRTMARDTNISPTKLSAYVNMSTTPSLKTLIRLCEYMDTDLNTITGIQPYNPIEETIETLENTIASLDL